MAKREGSPVRGREGLNSLGSFVIVSFSVDGTGVLLSDVEVEGVLVAVFGFLVR